MSWKERYGSGRAPDAEEIARAVDSPYWQALCGYLETAYSVAPRIEYSRCGMAPGWNVKYKKGSKSLCTLYPDEGAFTCLVVVGAKEAMEAELVLSGCTDAVQDLYRAAPPYNGGRWLMVEVTSPQVLEDVKKLIQVRVRPPRRK